MKRRDFAKLLGIAGAGAAIPGSTMARVAEVEFETYDPDLLADEIDALEGTVDLDTDTFKVCLYTEDGGTHGEWEVEGFIMPQADGETVVIELADIVIQPEEQGEIGTAYAGIQYNLDFGKNLQKELRSPFGFPVVSNGGLITVTGGSIVIR